MAYIDLISKLYPKTKRDYLKRVTDDDKAECAAVAVQYGKDYWDGERKYGYGGYSYDGRHRPVAEELIKHYGLKAGDKVLDIGCGKGYLLYEFSQVLPGLQLTGFDISEYAIENAKEEVKPFLRQGNAVSLPFEDHTFDLIVSVLALQNLYNYELRKALQEIQRVGKDNRKYIVIESYRNEREKANLLYWQLTCHSFYSPKEWEWFMEESGYTGDYFSIYFE